ncbi:methyltransferase, TIGR00027 family [Chitinophaga terrae (ex Kim and Jung 2007)]|uniref:S-adenosyl-L-methionine-dependent methyltransferase n=1 Tax=Chitinophaga terrae (ex Kim and Jung 2007) TaxID=408074 RepID=A0A1H4E443_9BACT|nr:SAM-dependent methyltransferase [Chitinophaga terrae (ex Kim and Jung 2007)]SEA79607.1 methyltransferase, TIGR00027 family [Chitinophaga terrae (ex Kim and Jung 2007)]
MNRSPARNTGVYMATFRALESTRPVNKRLLYDPYAIKFLPKFHRLLVSLSRFGPVRNCFIAYINARWPGTYTAGVARTRLIDDMVIEAVQHEGINQIIILNARYDTRAHRLKTSRQVNFVEIDHKDLQQRKRKIMKPPPGSRSLPVDYIELDIKTQQLAKVIPSPLLPRHYKTLFIWEALTTTRELNAAETIFEYLKDFPPGTQVIFSYVDKDVLVNPGHYTGFFKINKLLKKTGEQWDFGLHTHELPGFLAQRNMKLRYDGGATDYRALYYGEKSKRMKGYEYFRIVRAEVK